MKTNIAKIITIVLLLCAASSNAGRQTITRYLSGNAADVASGLVLGGPVLNLGGGGYDSDLAFIASIDTVRGCTGACATKLDVVIIRASGSDGYNSYTQLNGVDSVDSWVLTAAGDANDTTLETAVKNAEVIFFSGGDQCKYVTLFKGTKLEAAVEYAYARGAAIGGTSAGQNIQGEFVFDSCLTGVKAWTSSLALANPLSAKLSFTYNFFLWNFMNNILTEPHFVERDRMGRLIVALARQIKDGKTNTAWGLAVNAETSVFVNKVGSATVIGNNGTCCVAPIAPVSTDPVAYYILIDHPCESVVANVPLTCSNVKVWRRNLGETFNLANRPTVPDYTINVNSGVLSSVGNGGDIY